jgi:predicted enzyme related to lactoylglutathione lyase
MSIRTSPWPVGVPCYADVLTPDLASAQEFYGAVLGWAFTESSEEFGGYCMITKDGHVVGGMMPRDDQPAGWTVYFATDDLPGLLERIPTLGGTVITPAMQIAEAGSMALALDPSGAVFGLWQADQLIGAALTNQPGGLVWEDLRSQQPQVAQEFYLGLFSYRYQPVDMAGPDYAVFVNPGEEAPLGGMGAMMGAEGPSHWLAYFGVDGVDAAIAAARSHGGSVTQEAFDSPFGRMAQLADPAGGVFQIMEPSGQMPDREG